MNNKTTLILCTVIVCIGVISIVAYMENAKIETRKELANQRDFLGKSVMTQMDLLQKARMQGYWQAKQESQNQIKAEEQVKNRRPVGYIQYQDNA